MRAIINSPYFKMVAGTIIAALIGAWVGGYIALPKSFAVMEANAAVVKRDVDVIKERYVSKEELLLHMRNIETKIDSNGALLKEAMENAKVTRSLTEQHILGDK